LSTYFSMLILCDFHYDYNKNLDFTIKKTDRNFVIWSVNSLFIIYFSLPKENPLGGNVGFHIFRFIFVCLVYYLINSFFDQQWKINLIEAFFFGVFYEILISVFEKFADKK